MKRLIGRIATLAGIPVMAATLAATGAGAATTAAAHHHTQAVYTYYTKMIHRGDGGGGANTWAYDYFGRQLTIRYLGPGATSGTFRFTASLRDQGAFFAIPGQLAPNQGVPFAGSRIVRPVRGSMTGFGKFGEFTASAMPLRYGVPRVNFGAANPSATWPELAFATGTTFTGLSESSYGYFYKAQIPVHRLVVKVIKANGTMRLSQLAAAYHNRYSTLLRLNPWAKKFTCTGKVIPQGYKVKVLVLRTIMVPQHWVDASWNGDGQVPSAGNITGVVHFHH